MKSGRPWAPRADRFWRRVLGIMSGTSLDGVDFVLTGFEDERPRLLDHWHCRFTPGLVRRLSSCAGGHLSSWETAQLHHDLGRFYARAARPAAGRVQAVGLHGQTVFHQPEGPSPATFQLGEPAYLVESLRVPVVANFRAADLAAGGQGAPLATLFHLRTFAEPGRHVCVHNLGGISNVTSLRAPRRGAMQVMAFDTGPGNLLLDGAMIRLSGGRRRFDRNGALASRGTVHEPLVARWLRHPYLRQKPPKSTGRELFGEADLGARWEEMEAAGLPPADRLATLTEVTARSIALNYRWHLPSPPDRIILCGGGSRNGGLVRRLAHGWFVDTPGVEVLQSTELGWPAEAVEGAAFALLARERLLGRPGNLPSTTGARGPVLCGQIAWPLEKARALGR